MPRYLYIFGFASPEQIEGLEKHGWDGEASEAVLIEATSEQEALAWGQEISREFIRRLYGARGLVWSPTDYANWIESAPETQWSPQDLTRLQIVKVGEHPPLDGIGIAQNENR